MWKITKDKHWVTTSVCVCLFSMPHTLIGTEAPFAVVIVALGGGTPHLAIAASRWGAGLVGVSQESEGKDARASLCVSSHCRHGWWEKTKGCEITWLGSQVPLLSAERVHTPAFSFRTAGLWYIESGEDVENSIMEALARHTRVSLSNPLGAQPQNYRPLIFFQRETIFYLAKTLMCCLKKKKSFICQTQMC